MGKVTIMCHCTLPFKMGRLGFEPRTNRLKAEYSTVELATLENLVVTICFHGYKS